MKSDLDLEHFEQLSKELLHSGAGYNSCPWLKGEDTKKCFKIFLELGDYLLDRLNHEMNLQEKNA